MVRFTSIVIALAALFTFGTQAGHGKPSHLQSDAVALVVGNAAYGDNPLENPINDSQAVAGLLRSSGFDVILVNDADEAMLGAALAEFRARRSKDGTAVVYFAGHGLQDAGETFLLPVGPLPVDADKQTHQQRPQAGLSLSSLTAKVAGDGKTLILLDICRTGPDATAVTALQSAEPALPRNTLLAMAASQGQAANDGAEGYGLFTHALLHALQDSPTSLQAALLEARDQVQAVTAGEQTPVIRLSADYSAEATPPEKALLQAPQLASLELAQLRMAPGRDRGIQPKKSGAHDLEFWNAIKDSTDPADYEAYLESFPEGSFAPLARLRIRQYSKNAAEPTKDDPGFEVENMEMPFVALANANVRAKPTADSDKVGELSRGGDVEVTGDVVGANWYRVRVDGKTGYVFGDLIKSAISNGATPSTPASSPATQEAAAPAAQQPEPVTTPAVSAVTPAKEEPATPPAPEAKAETKVAVTAKKVTEETATTVAALPKVSVPAGAGNRDCEGCPELVQITPGSFVMGSNNGNDNERPATKVTIRKPYAIGRYEVSVGEWALCVAEGGCKYKPKKKAGQSDRSPMGNLSWLDAMEYVNWLREKTGRRYRLPSEAEWEYAARAGTESRYWWGGQVGSGQVDCKDCGTEWVRKNPPAIGSFGANPFGLHDTSGSVWEWTADCWNKSHDGAPRDGSARSRSDCRQRVLRGGSWRNEPDYLRSASRFNYDANVRYLVNGFRVAVDSE